MNKWTVICGFLLLQLLDIALLFLIAHYIGVWCTLLLVLLSNLAGLALWNRWLRSISAQNEQFRQQYGANIPPDVILLNATDALLYFFPARPLKVSPIGGYFFTWEGMTTVLNEVYWLGIPSAAILSICAFAFKKQE